MKTMGAVLIEGPKACGKTMTAEQLAATSYYVVGSAVCRRNTIGS